MIRSGTVLLLLAVGSPAPAQTADAIREVRDVLNKLNPPKVNPFGGVQQRPGPVPVPQPPPGGVQPLGDVLTPIKPTPRRVRPPGPTPGGPPKLDAHGDLLPPGAIARFGTVRLRHGAEPAALTFSPDGKVLGSFSTTEDGLRLWDTATGKEIARHVAPITCAAFTRDGRVVLTDGPRCKVWHPTTNALREFPDGTIPEGTTAVCAHPDGTTLVAASPDKIALIDLQTGRPKRELKTPAGATPNRVAFSPDGRWLAGSGLGTGVWLWEVRTGKRLRTYQAAHPEACEFAFSPDGTRLAVATDKVRVYPTDSQDELDGFNPPDDALANPTFSADGKTVFALDLDGNVKRIDAATGELGDDWNSPAADSLRIPLALAPGGALVAATDRDGGIRVWNPETGKGPTVERLTMLYDPGLSADGKAAACLDSVSRLHTFDPLTGKLVKTAQLPIDAETPVSWDPKFRRAAAVVMNEEIRIIDVYANAVTSKFPLPTETGLPTVAFCPADRTRVAVLAPGLVVVVNAPTGRVVRTINTGGRGDQPRGGFSPDGRLFTVSAAPRPAVWEVSTGKKRFELELDNPVDSVFSPDGRLLAAWDTSDTIVLFDLRTGTTARRFQLPGGDGSLSCAAFSPDGKKLATGDLNGVVALWDVATGESLLVLDRHEGQVSGLRFSADGTRLLSTSHDGTALYWDLTARPLPEAVQAVAGLDDAFKLLGSGDAVLAQRGMDFLYRRPAEAVPFLVKVLPVPKAVSADRIARLIAELDSDDFLTRQAAAKELEAVGGEATAALRTAAEKSPSAEVRKAAGELAAKGDGPATRPDDLRVLRAVEVMEHLGTPASRDALKAWAAGPAGHRLTTEAAAAAKRK